MLDPLQQVNVLCIVWIPSLNTKFNVRPYVGFVQYVKGFLRYKLISISYLKKKSHKVYLWRQANLHEMSNILCDFGSDFVNVNTIDTSIEKLWCDLRNKLLEVMDSCVPSKTKYSNFHQPWINRKLKQLRRKKQRSYNLARSTNLPIHWSHYKYLKKVMQKECRKAFNEYMSDIIHEQSWGSYF